MIDTEILQKQGVFHESMLPGFSLSLFTLSKPYMRSPFLLCLNLLG